VGVGVLRQRSARWRRGTARLRLHPPDGMRQRGRSFDLPGAVTVTAGVTLLAFALIQGPESGWTSPLILASFALAALLVAGFLAIEARSRDPFMPLRLMASRSLSGSMAVTLIFGATFSALPYFLTLYFQTVHGYSALMTGAAFLVPSLVIAAGTQVGERMATRAGMRLTLLTGIVTGAALLAVGMTTGGSYWSVLAGIVVMGLGQGLTWTGMWIAACAGSTWRSCRASAPPPGSPRDNRESPPAWPPPPCRSEPRLAWPYSSRLPPGTSPG
jgi:hypothetical protein